MYCNNDSALNNVFHRQFQGITQFTASDHNLVSTAQDHIKLLPVMIKDVWVKGHSNSKNPTIQEELNNLADNLAKEYAENPPHSFNTDDSP